MLQDILGHLVYSLIFGMTLFATAWVRNQFQGENKDTLKDLALASLFAVIGIGLLPVFEQIPVLGSFLASLGWAYSLAVIWICFQLEDLMDFLFFGVMWGLMSFLVQAPLTHAVNQWL